LNERGSSRPHGAEPAIATQVDTRIVPRRGIDAGRPDAPDGRPWRGRNGPAANRRGEATAIGDPACATPCVRAAEGRRPWPRPAAGPRNEARRIERFRSNIGPIDGQAR